LLAQNITATTCRSASLQFAQYSGDGTYDTYIQFIQSASDPESQSTPKGTIGTMNATFDGGPWILNVAADGYSGDVVQINGTFDCYSLTGT
jgi:hypothetical protein